jgi:hypothetical protein
VTILRDKEEFYQGQSEYGSWQCHLIKLTDESGAFGLVVVHDPRNRLACLLP